MTDNRVNIARQVADQLFAAETAIDTALAKTAALAGLMPSVREDARLSALVGQGAVERAIETMAALGEARRKIVETHKQLSITQKQMGLGPLNFGGWVDKPQFARAGLAAVEAA
ncbi:hypothetical protein ACFOMD_17605 [Sphingoaurantiacus capsulatus]|uniref:Uncharacterized protein n=1 Tax=Sphingoaurantiacus capsulatus TaxID=1771310 RepID=A0ABV7XGI1_9SPHN